ncbi:uncharacterized protein LOC127749254 [Frankliniella occidentalis]|uniref:Uncharacterized protein LOC127749254 n=1 Tax=Frankliniella occidentalis TaxID=133901 RepID=A0A9C6TYL2_FRAOC|nr:uncharacterized protein LOC127749254 [Frankliniella occidentalis]
MTTKNQLMQQLCRSVPLDPMELSLTDLGLINPDELPLDLPCLPLKSMAHVDAFENLLLNIAYFKQIVLFLGALGGTDTFDTTRRVMSKLMTNRLAVSFNWAGRPPKRAFRQMLCKNLVINAVRQNPMLPQPVLECEIEQHIKKWLRYASGRNQDI